VLFSAVLASSSAGLSPACWKPLVDQQLLSHAPDQNGVHWVNAFRRRAGRLSAPLDSREGEVPSSTDETSIGQDAFSGSVTG
jgi:hypothetical protein